MHDPKPESDQGWWSWVVLLFAMAILTSSAIPHVTAIAWLLGISLAFDAARPGRNPAPVNGGHPYRARPVARNSRARWTSGARVVLGIAAVVATIVAALVGMARM